MPLFIALIHLALLHSIVASLRIPPYPQLSRWMPPLNVARHPRYNLSPDCEVLIILPAISVPREQLAIAAEAVGCNLTLRRRARKRDAPLDRRMFSPPFFIVDCKLRPGQAAQNRHTDPSFIAITSLNSNCKPDLGFFFLPCLVKYCTRSRSRVLSCDENVDHVLYTLKQRLLNNINMF